MAHIWFSDREKGLIWVVCVFVITLLFLDMIFYSIRGLLFGNNYVKRIIDIDKYIKKLCDLNLFLFLSFGLIHIFFFSWFFF